MFNTNQRIKFTARTNRKGMSFHLCVSGNVKLDEPTTKKKLIDDMKEAVLVEFNQPYIEKGQAPFWTKEDIKITLKVA